MTSINLKISLSSVGILFCVLATYNACAHAENPVMHTVLLQNDTIIPEEQKNLPLVGKCCDRNEFLVKNESMIASCRTLNSSRVESFSPFFNEYNKSGVISPGEERRQFVAIIGDPCLHGRYMLYPEKSSEDEYYLLLNGSVFAPHHAPNMLQPGEDYCTEVVPDLGLRVLVCFPEERVVTADSRITIYAYGLLISVPFFILTIVAYAITPKLRDVHGKALCHYCGCLALAFTTLAFTQLGTTYFSDQFCVCIAFIIQFSFVACFFWLNVMCIETWALVRNYVHRDRCKRIQPKRLFFYYSLWGWGPPAILILISMAMDLNPTIPTSYVKPNFGKDTCWFRSDDDAMPYFYVPAGLLLLGNVILFIVTSIKLTRYQQELALRRLARNDECDRRDQRLLGRLRRTFVVCTMLFFLMGLNWTMELVSWWAGGDLLGWSAFDLVNALQGVIIFGLFVLRRPPRDFVWHSVQKRCGRNVPEPEIGSMELTLLPIMNGDMTPGHTILS